ncbi:MAG: glycosyltransferase family 2 protein [Aquaticitalea sp.]
MNKSESADLQLEILVSTLHRTSLDFLDVMFQNNELHVYRILIINQTSEEQILISDDPNIRVLNSYEKGLSKSRNLAIANAVGDICLLADDDVVYLKGFENPIIEAYQKLEVADIITFKTLTTENKAFYDYPKQIGKLGSFSKYVLSIELSFRRSSIVNGSIRFDENFGLGATFQDSENHIFLRELQNHTQLKLFFVPEFITIHPPQTSSSDVASDRLIFARSALNYKFYGNAAYIYIFKLLFYLLRHRLITLSEITTKFNVGHTAIKNYKRLKKEVT